MTLMPVLIAAALLLAAVFLFLFARYQRRLGGLPEGKLIYNDKAAGDCPVLVSRRYGLKGKPDAVVRTESGDVIPVERKKTRAPRTLRGRSHPGDGLLHSGRGGDGAHSAIHAHPVCRPLVR